MNDEYVEPMTEPCEFCGIPVLSDFSLCDECSDTVKYFNEVTGNYHLKNGEIIDTTKHQFEETLPNTLELCTHDHDGENTLIFAVTIGWLSNNVNGSLKQYLSEYTFDDSERLYRLASEQEEVLSIRYI